jgi:hypothetical protein
VIGCRGNGLGVEFVDEENLEGDECLVFGKRMCVGVIEREDQRMTFTGYGKEDEVEKLMTIPRVSFVWSPVATVNDLHHELGH